MLRINNFNDEHLFLLSLANGELMKVHLTRLEVHFQNQVVNVEEEARLGAAKEGRVDVNEADLVDVVVAVDREECIVSKSKIFPN